MNWNTNITYTKLQKQDTKAKSKYANLDILHAKFIIIKQW